MNKNFSNWKEPRAVLKNDLRIKKKVCSIEEWLREKYRINLWRTSEFWPKYGLAVVVVKEPQNIDGARRREVFDFPVYRICMWIVCHLNLNFSLVSPSSSFTSFCMCSSGFLEMVAVYCKFGRNLIVIYGMKFLIYPSQTPCNFSLGNVSRVWLQLRQYATKKCQYLLESLSSLWWFILLIFLTKLILSFKMFFSFDLIIFKKCHGFLCCRSTVKWV